MVSRLELVTVSRWTLSVQLTCTAGVGPCARSVPSWAFIGARSANSSRVPVSPCVAADLRLIRPEIEFAPQARHTLAVTYDVPAAAVREGDGLAYRLALDPQGMVDPQDVRVRVSFPRGYTVEDGLPEGWSTRGGRVATYTTDALETVESFEILARP